MVCVSRNCNLFQRDISFAWKVLCIQGCFWIQFQETSPSRLAGLPNKKLQGYSGVVLRNMIMNLAGIGKHITDAMFWEIFRRAILEHCNNWIYYRRKQGSSNRTTAIMYWDLSKGPQESPQHFLSESTISWISRFEIEVIVSQHCRSDTSCHRTTWVPPLRAAARVKFRFSGIRCQELIQLDQYLTFPKEIEVFTGALVSAKSVMREAIRHNVRFPSNVFVKLIWGRKILQTIGGWQAETRMLALSCKVIVDESWDWGFNRLMKTTSIVIAAWSPRNWHAGVNNLWGRQWVKDSRHCSWTESGHIFKILKSPRPPIMYGL